MVLMLATQYNANVKIVTRNIVVSTLLSVITIPIVVATMLLQEKNMNYKIYDQLPQEAKEIRIKVFMEEQGFKMNLMIQMKYVNILLF